MKVLHVAPINVAGVPYLMMDMQRRFGADARLVTLHRSMLTFPEDICLNLPLPQNPLARRWRTSKGRAVKQAELRQGHPDTFLPVHSPRNLFESAYFRFDDVRRKRIIDEAIAQYRLDDFDIIHYDGGLDLFRDSRLAAQWKRKGKKIVCHYMGSDLRLRGIVPRMDALSDLNLTNESDHLLRHPRIHYLYIPFDATPYAARESSAGRLRIVHAPTNRAMKGTEYIIPVIEAVKKVRDIEFRLVENTSHAEVIRLKQTCDIAIEQVGNLGGTGYGRNSLETMAMGIPTVTEMTKDYIDWIPENPFVLATRHSLYDVLISLIDNASLREEYAFKGRSWVQKYHSYDSVHQRLTQLYREHNIL